MQTICAESKILREHNLQAQFSLNTQAQAHAEIVNLYPRPLWQEFSEGYVYKLPLSL